MKVAVCLEQSRFEIRSTVGHCDFIHHLASDRVQIHMRARSRTRHKHAHTTNTSQTRAHTFLQPDQFIITTVIVILAEVVHIFFVRQRLGLNDIDESGLN